MRSIRPAPGRTGAWSSGETLFARKGETDSNRNFWVKIYPFS